MATQKGNPAKEGEVADAEEEEFFTDSEEEDGELLVGRRDVASDDEGEAEEGEIQDGHAAAGISHRHSLQGMTKILWMLVSDFQFFDEDDNIPALPCDGLAQVSSLMLGGICILEQRVFHRVVRLESINQTQCLGSKSLAVGADRSHR